MYIWYMHTMTTTSCSQKTHLIFDVLNCASDELSSGHDTHCPQLTSNGAHTKLELNLLCVQKKNNSASINSYLQQTKWSD